MLCGRFLYLGHFGFFCFLTRSGLCGFPLGLLGLCSGQRAPIDSGIDLVEDDLFSSLKFAHILVGSKIDRVSAHQHHPAKAATKTHVMGFSISRRAGLPSAILSILTGCVLMCSRIVSNMKLRGAFVLILPCEAWDRETSYPALRRAEIV